ncbi:MAG: hypothetical protein JST75_18250 [Bacteroidetes bacterium]|nr:hypothetical protein [Bacteroidota bacterium]
MSRLIGSTLLIFAILFSFTTLAQDSGWKKYSISKSVNASSLNYKKLFHGKSKAALENNLAEFYLYRNGQLIKPPKDSSRNFFTAGCICFKFDDTLLLNSGLGRAAGVGVGIKIYQGKFTSSLHGSADDKTAYKFKKSDSAYMRDINTQPETQSLKLFQKPSFVADETIIGEYNATFKKFYQKIRRKDESRKYTVRLIFKCKITSMDSIKSGLENSSK